MKLNLLLSVILVFVISFFFGISSYTFTYGEGYSYLLDDPKACINCHVMNDQYDSWKKSSHAMSANCNSCHSPDDFLMKYLYKAENGFMHSLKFTTGDYKKPIKIRSHNLEVTLSSCKSCHKNLIDDHLTITNKNNVLKQNTCLHCHKNVGHDH